MFRHVRLISFVFILSGLTRLGSAESIEKPEPQKIDGKINWIYDYEQGQRESKKSGKPMFVVFRCER